MNISVIIGRLTKDPEVRYTTGANQTAVCNFTLAVDRIGEGADFITCVAFGKTAENIGKFMSKGRQLAVRGHIQTGSYEKDGQRRYTTDVIVERAKFVGSKTDDKPSDAKPLQEIPDGFETIDESDVPF